MVQSMFRYFEPFSRDSLVWQTDRRTDGRADSLTTYAVLLSVAQQKKQM